MIGITFCSKGNVCLQLLLVVYQKIWKIFPARLLLELHSLCTFILACVFIELSGFLNGQFWFILACKFIDFRSTPLCLLESTLPKVIRDLSHPTLYYQPPFKIFWISKFEISKRFYFQSLIHQNLSWKRCFWSTYC